MGMGYELDQTELYLFNTGKSAYAYRALGAHRVSDGDNPVFRFAVWAPHAAAVSVVGDFNGWNASANPMHRREKTGIWEAHVPAAAMGHFYQYAILAKNGELTLKADPFAVTGELRPGTASAVYELADYPWSDAEYRQKNAALDPFSRPMSIYEVHPGSWKAGLGLKELSEELVRYAKDMGYTHIELLPISEFPYDGSWGYQVTGYYAISSRYGAPQDLRLFVDRAHAAGLGVILDWVPAHFPKDAHGLRLFDGTPAYESLDPKLSEQPQWGTLQFDYGKAEVQSFLISNAVYYAKEFHIDGLRVDAVSCMLYLDYGRAKGEWERNRLGGIENLDAIDFLKKLSEAVARECPGTLLIAEESTSFPMVTKPPSGGGLGFHFKWNMGWMNDTLSYMSCLPQKRSGLHKKITFSLSYAFSENFILPLSHDEVVHGKRSLIGRMNGSYEEQFAQLRLLYMYQFAHPGKKLMFMGDEFAQFIEWNFQKSLDWLLLDYPMHRAMQRFVASLNRFYTSAAALYEQDSSWDGFAWLSVDDAERSVIAFLRRAINGDAMACVFNFSQNDYPSYRLPLEAGARLREVFASDAPEFGGTEEALREITYGTDFSGDYANVPLPPFSGIYFSVDTDVPHAETP